MLVARSFTVRNLLAITSVLGSLSVMSRRYRRQHASLTTGVPLTFSKSHLNLLLLWTLVLLELLFFREVVRERGPECALLKFV